MPAIFTVCAAVNVFECPRLSVTVPEPPSEIGELPMVMEPSEFVRPMVELERLEFGTVTPEGNVVVHAGTPEPFVPKTSLFAVVIPPIVFADEEYRS